MQVGEARSAAELDVFADELARLALESPSKEVAGDAISALSSAAVSYGDDEIAYERALALLIDIHKAMDGTEAVDDWLVWSAIARAGGEDYLANLFASLEPPAKPCWKRPQIIHENQPPNPPQEEWCPYTDVPWCELGVFLAHKVSSPLEFNKYEIEGVDPTHVFSTCNKYTVQYPDGSWHTIYD